MAKSKTKTKTKSKTKVYVVLNESKWPTTVVGVFSTRGLAMAGAKKERQKWPNIGILRISHHMVDNPEWYVGKP